jgi:hypothetical protein
VKVNVKKYNDLEKEFQVCGWLAHKQENKKDVTAHATTSTTPPHPYFYYLSHRHI